MKKITFIFAICAVLSACQSPTKEKVTPLLEPQLVNETVVRYKAALYTAIDVCLDYVEVGQLDSAPLMAIGFERRKILGGNVYVAKLGSGTLARLSSTAVTVVPIRKNTGCGIYINNVGGAFSKTTDIVTSHIVANGWTFAPQRRRHVYTKQGRHIKLVGSSFNALKSYTIIGP